MKTNTPPSPFLVLAIQLRQHGIPIFLMREEEAIMFPHLDVRFGTESANKPSIQGE